MKKHAKTLSICALAALLTVNTLLASGCSPDPEREVISEGIGEPGSIAIEDYDDPSGSSSAGQGSSSSPAGQGEPSSASPATAPTETPTPTPDPTPDPTPEPQPETVYVTGSDVNVRSQPSTESEVLGVVQRGASFTRTSDTDGWSTVEYSGTTAYIKSDFLTTEAPSGFKSSVDKDGDGIDDQTDILQSARDYVAKRPKYESRWYDTGYPNDGYGVCTDVVAFALLGAGYDLQALMDEDIRSDPDAYEIYDPDRNIDFRRAVNQLVYFQRHAVSLTTDLNDTEAWQGGDIVVFDHHVGIISDRRNDAGIPYLIHHRGVDQEQYEEDFFGIRNDILGHFRISE